ncbi:NADP-dependent oxidoreductase [Spirosoma oryzicola]|uniref:NADP-dependent oxidoreductase n=1 Tax=Spirosoma oryzicola TaxID=2898794 RepID=UPI001E2B207F|nr:NADP-dependent oxidoreductase [Spirosoma oryzicola]UHG93968.1 NADP-dependent oxidoreductase [Spirosoma oryzicola]
MRAIVLNEFGGVDQLVITDVPKPTIKEDEVLIKVKAISINPVDVKTRAGKGIAGRLRDNRPLIIGWDISGTITEVGEQVTDFKIGDDVFGMVNFPGHGKAYAEYVAAPASQLAVKPATVSHQEAAAATLAALTAYQAFMHKAPVHPGQRLLIHAAAGGVGHFAVQLAKHLGAYVIGTSSAANKEFVLSLGADEHIDYTTERFEEAVSDIDLVLDLVGGQNIVRSLEVIKSGGTLISIPTGISDELAAQAKANDVTAFFFLVQSNGADMQQIATLLDQGALKSHVSQTYSFDNMEKAHLQQETGKTKGKLVITLD